MPSAAATATAAQALAFTAFIALVLVGAAHHELWRDEVRALTAALEPDRWLGLAAAMENEGHPALWQLLLRAAHDVAGTPAVLRVVAAAIGIGAGALLCFCSPLPTWWRVMFLSGWVPLYACSVLCRNYGIGVLLLFGFCRFASGTSFRPVLAAAALSLLANTNAYGLMIAAGLGLFLAIEAARRRATVRTLALVLLLPVAGIALAAWTMMPTPSSKIVPSVSASFRDLGGTVLDGLAAFGAHTTSLFGWAPLAWPVVLLTAAATLRRPHLGIAVLGVCGAAAWFMQRIYGAAPHHLSMLYALLVAAAWLRAGDDGERGAIQPPIARIAWRVLLHGVWPPLLLFQGYRGLREIKDEVELSRTAAPELARLLERDDLRDAVLIGEPDYFLDALPYYRGNRIFVAREDRFARRPSWTIANRRELDLGELLASAQQVQREHGAPVLLVIGQQIRLDRPDGTVAHGYGDQFRWTAPQHAAFVAATEHVASLPARPSRCRGDERYEVYRLRQ